MASPFCGNNEKKINLKEEIEKKMNCLDDDEENEEKIIKNTHKILLLISSKEAIDIMAMKEEKNELNELNEEEEIILFNKLIKHCYLEKLEFIRKELKEEKEEEEEK